MMKELYATMPSDEFPYEAKCPWCQDGKLMIKKPAKTKASCKCPRCQKCFEVDFETLEVKKVQAIPNKGNTRGRKQLETA